MGIDEDGACVTTLANTLRATLIKGVFVFPNRGYQGYQVPNYLDRISKRHVENDYPSHEKDWV